MLRHHVTYALTLHTGVQHVITYGSQTILRKKATLTIQIEVLSTNSDRITPYFASRLSSSLPLQTLVQTKHVFATERESGDQRRASSRSKSRGHEDSAEAPAYSCPRTTSKRRRRGGICERQSTKGPRDCVWSSYKGR